MENLDENKILGAIEADVESNASLVQETLAKEISAFHDDQLAFFKAGLQKETEAYLEKEMNELHLRMTTLASKNQMEAKKNLLLLRERLSESLYSDVASDIEAFTQTKEYETFLEKQIRELPISDDGVFYVREQDQAKFTVLINTLHLNNPVKTMKMRLGGFIYRNDVEGSEYSCDLFERLLEAEEWFRSTSNFRALESEEQK